MKRKILAFVVAGLVPSVSFAAVAITTSVSGGVYGLLKWFGDMLILVVPLIISLAVVYFIWQVFRYAIAGNEEDKAKAKTHMIWGIVGIFVMVSVWGLVGILTSTFGTAGQSAMTGPSINVIGQ